MYNFYKEFAIFRKNPYFSDTRLYREKASTFHKTRLLTLNLMHLITKEYSYQMLKKL